MNLERFNELLEDSNIKADLLDLLETRKTSDLEELLGVFQIMSSNLVYKRLTLPKGRGRVRNIDAPHVCLKSVQRSLLPFLTQEVLPEYVYGFRSRMGTVMGVRQALDRFVEKNGEDAKLTNVFRTDIRNFFPSITSDQCRTELQKLLEKSSVLESNVPKMIEVLSQICMHNENLPQGAATSPALSNLVGVSTFDPRIQEMLEQEYDGRVVYMRYADDITLLAAEEIHKDHRGQIADILREHGFEMAKEKTSYDQNAKHHSILGLHIPRHEGGPIGFRIRPLTARRWAANILHLFSRGIKISSKKKNFMSSRKVHRVLGRCFYAQHVGELGDDPNSLAKDSWLPKPLAHAWNIFKSRNASLLPQQNEDWFKRDEEQGRLF